jgi:hypothetical protein
MKRYETDGKSFYLQKDNCPARCSTWSAKAQDLGQFNFSESELIWDDSHDTFIVYECQTCGSHYLWHWHEEIDWDNGNDSASTCARSLRDADLIALRYFQGTQPLHPEFKRFLEALV